MVVASGQAAPTFPQCWLCIPFPKPGGFEAECYGGPVTGPCPSASVYGERLVRAGSFPRTLSITAGHAARHQWLLAPHSGNRYHEELALALGY